MLISFMGDALPIAIGMYTNALLNMIRLPGGFFEWQISVK